MKKVIKDSLYKQDKQLSMNKCLEKELNDANKVINNFLKVQFTIDIHSLQQYLQKVKDLLIQLTTKAYSPLITNIFSKLSNILQPFTSYSFDISLDNYKNQINQLKQYNNKIQRKNLRLKSELQQYRIKSNKSMDFIYMLRLNNVNVDELFRKGLTNSINSNYISANSEKQDVKIDRAKMQIDQSIFEVIDQNSNLISQYSSTRYKKN